MGRADAALARPARAEWPFTVTTTEAPHYRRVVIESHPRMSASDARLQRMRQES